MKTFELVRLIDDTGLSGTGFVAEGVVFSDGVVALRWLTPSISPENLQRGVRPTTVVHESLDSVLALHGHGGLTYVQFADGTVMGARQAPGDQSRRDLVARPRPPED